MTPATQAAFAKDSWQTPRNARTLRAFMALRNQEIAARLRELRGEQPQTTIAEKVGVSERTYQNWEAGDAKPAYRNLQRLAAFYGVGESFILSGEGLAMKTPEAKPTTDADRLDTLAKQVAANAAMLAEILALLRGDQPGATGEDGGAGLPVRPPFPEPGGGEREAEAQ